MSDSLLKLARDSSSEKKHELAEHVTGLLVARADDPGSEETHLLNNMLEGVYDSLAHDAKRKMSERLADVPSMSSKLAAQWPATTCLWPRQCWNAPSRFARKICARSRKPRTRVIFWPRQARPRQQRYQQYPDQARQQGCQTHAGRQPRRRDHHAGVRKSGEGHAQAAW